MNRARLTELAPWVIVTTVPMAAFVLMRVRPDLDFAAASPDGHFYIVSLVAVISAALGLAGAIVATRARDARVTLLALSFFSMGVIFAVHGLSTPGFVVDERYDAVTSLASRFAIVTATCFLALSAARWPRQVYSRMGRWGDAFVSAWILLLIGTAALVLAFPGLAPTGLVREPLALHGSFALVIVGAAFAAWHYGRAYYRSGVSMYGSVALGSVLIVESQLGMEYGQKFHLSWWAYHVFLLMAVTSIAWGVLVEYTRGRSPIETLAGLTLSDPARAVQAGYTESIVHLVQAMEARDGYTLGHGERVAALSTLIARRLGLGDDEYLRALHGGALLHDVGKAAISDTILQKRARLTDAEFAAVKEHPGRGQAMLRAALDGRTELAIIRHHHERYDGSGYPDGLKEQEIPLAARIVAVADVYDALRSARPHRPAWEADRARAHIEELSRVQFDPDCVRAFLAVVEDWERHFATGEIALSTLRPRIHAA